MNEKARLLIIPVENQVRELDAKLLLAAMAAERGFSVILGSRAYVHFIAGTIPSGIYIAKSMRAISTSMFRILRSLGHAIVAWEEEALVHPPDEIFYGLRMSPETVSKVSHLFCWGDEYRDLVSRYPHLTEQTKLHVSGNPRGDMLRPELRKFFDEAVLSLRKTYGDYILLNTNFSDVNPYIPSIGLFSSGSTDGKLGQAGKGMTVCFATGLYSHKKRLLLEFEDLVGKLANAFPYQNIIVRPHPSESMDFYEHLSDAYRNVHVINTGNVIPWLLASKALVHNGCTTAVEASVMNIPTFSYMPVKSQLYDYEFQGLPNWLSCECGSSQELIKQIREVLRGRDCWSLGTEQKILLDYYLAATDGPLASERILDVLQSTRLDSCTDNTTRILAVIRSQVKALLTKAYMNFPGPNRLDYHDHRFPEISSNEIQLKIDVLGKTLNRFGSVKVKPHSPHIFHITNDSMDKE